MKETKKELELIISDLEDCIIAMQKGIDLRDLKLKKARKEIRVLKKNIVGPCSMPAIKFEALEDKYFGKKGTSKRKKYDSDFKKVVKKLRKNKGKK